MKLPIACSLLTCLAAAACTAPSGTRSNHWNLESVGPRIAYHGFRYRSDRDGSYREFQWREKRTINRTLRRHLLNDNPDNPFQHPIPERTPVRPPNSIVPDPVTFFHVSSLAWGGIIYGASGAFVPVPVDSLLGMFEHGGVEEFGDGLAYTVGGKDWNPDGEPTPPEEFEVKTP